MKTTEELMTFNKANVEAFVRSSQIFATGLQDISKMFAASAQTTMDEAMSTFRAMTSVRTVKEALELQAGLARSTMEKAVAHTGQFAETSFKLAEQTMAPVASRVSTAVETFKVA